VLQAVTVALAATATGCLWRPTYGWLQSSLLAWRRRDYVGADDEER
jgi:hypothetical protein